jgi:tetratricopeptide (TPR) repeat protein
MRKKFIIPNTASIGILCLAAFGLLAPNASAQDAAPVVSNQAITELDKELDSAKEGSSEARQRLAVRRVIRDAEEQVASQKDSPNRFPILEFLFRARQQLIALDDATEHRTALLETCRELIKAPDEFAELRLEADLLLSQAELAKQGANTEARAEALRPFVERYIDTPVAAKVLRLTMVMALELGDSRLVTDLQETIEKRFAGDLEMIAFQRDKLGGQVFGAPFAGTFERSDGKMARFPMDGLGRTTMFVFWSKEEGGEELIKGMAAASLKMKEELAGRLEIISFNLDGLPDAGESFVRAQGVDWQVLRLPDGRKNPIFDAYVRNDPRILTVSPTGYTALIMSGTTRQKQDTGGEPDYGRMFGSSLAREWTQPRYVEQLSSLMAGDFLVIDPEGGIDPTLPPELKSLGEGSRPLSRTGASVPEETLRAIQACFVAPPVRYRQTYAEARASYAKAAGLCRKAISDHPNAPDLWIVRNRLMVALLGLWKTDANLGRLEEAIDEAKIALEKGYPSGCDIIARFCIAREALRDPAADTRAVLDKFMADNGGDKAPGPVFAVASLLALDVADRKRYEDFKEIILKSHTEQPMMWTFAAFLLDRYHNYWLFQVPFTAGWSYGRRADYFLTKGDSEKAHRMLRAELRTLDGGIFRIPEDLDTEWTAIVFAQPGPWNKKRDDGLPVSPERLVQSLADFATSRPGADMKVYLATFGGDAEAIKAGFGEKGSPSPVLTVPDGLNNPLVHRLGILSEDNELNSLLISKDGRIVVVLSGLAKQSGRGGSSLVNVIQKADEEFVSAALERGDIDAAKSRILALAPPFDPEAVDEKGRKLKIPQYSLSHLRARARAYMALEEWDKALADAEEVVQRQLGTDGGMSLRTDELDESEELRATILRKKEEASK